MKSRMAGLVCLVLTLSANSSSAAVMQWATYALPAATGGNETVTTIASLGSLGTISIAISSNGTWDQAAETGSIPVFASGGAPYYEADGSTPLDPTLLPWSNTTEWDHFWWDGVGDPTDPQDFTTVYDFSGLPAGTLASAPVWLAIGHVNYGSQFNVTFRDAQGDPIAMSPSYWMNLSGSPSSFGNWQGSTGRIYTIEGAPSAVALFELPADLATVEAIGPDFANDTIFTSLGVVVPLPPAAAFLFTGIGWLGAFAFWRSRGTRGVRRRV